LCFGSALIFVESEERKEQELMIANNEFVCEECYNYLSNRDKKICNFIYD